jgi:hypothetical protein
MIIIIAFFLSRLGVADLNNEEIIGSDTSSSTFMAMKSNHAGANNRIAAATSHVGGARGIFSASASRLQHFEDLLSIGHDHLPDSSPLFEGEEVLLRSLIFGAHSSSDDDEDYYYWGI